ncbi:MAG: TolC family protein, partial [Planctomycetota bacterium]
AEKTHVIQTQVQISQLENDLLTLGRTRDTVRARIAALLNLPAAAPLAEPVPPVRHPFPTDLDALQRVALVQQPEVLAAQARAARMATMIELAEQSTYPELSSGLAYLEDIPLDTGGIQKEPEPFSTTPKVKPDPWFGSKEAYLREAREGERAARDRVVAARDRTAFQLTSAWNALDTAKRLYELYRDVQLSQAEQAYSDASAGYAADRVEFLNVIDSLRQWLRFLLDADRATRDYEQAHARLESALGGPVGKVAPKAGGANGGGR